MTVTGPFGGLFAGGMCIAAGGVYVSHANEQLQLLARNLKQLSMKLGPYLERLKGYINDLDVTHAVLGNLKDQLTAAKNASSRVQLAVLADVKSGWARTLAAEANDAHQELMTLKQLLLMEHGVQLRQLVLAQQPRCNLLN
eukprot:m.218697 g.218697  ORF g.218697 m.218697 type:complete len:141 (+) comp10157_c1_seq32:1180-1602(+)